MNTCVNCRELSKSFDANFCWYCGGRLLRSEEADGIAKRQTILARRLQILQEKAAYHGIHTPPDIIMEIEDLEKSITKLTQKLEIIKKIPFGNKKLIILELEFQKNKPIPTLLKIKRLDVALTMSVYPNNVQITTDKDDVFIFRMVLPEDEADNFMAAYISSNNPLIQALQINRARIINTDPNQSLGQKTAHWIEQRLPSKLSFVSGSLVWLVSSQ